jgi:tRNA dimethylallyltransferase
MANHRGPILIAGPTAVGKSELALSLAERLNGEIISVDSMQVYRGLDIGTAKPSLEERQRVPHHLIDVVDLTAPFDAAQFVRLAQAAVAEIESRGHVPIFCGGTGLYFKAYLEGLGDAPPADEALRMELEKTPLSELINELAEKDPITFEKIDRQNPRRVIRAIEVIRLTGKPFSAQRAAWQPLPQDSPTTRDTQPPTRFFCLSRESTDLHTRINARVDVMFQRGLVEEVKNLMNHGLAENKNAMQAIGYRQVVEHLRGERSLRETIELVKIRTRQFAKRQMTWFRCQAQVNWISLSSKETTEELAAKIFQSSLRPD